MKLKYKQNVRLVTYTQLEIQEMKLINAHIDHSYQVKESGDDKYKNWYSRFEEIFKSIWKYIPKILCPLDNV